MCGRQECKRRTVSNFCSSVPWQGEPLWLFIAVVGANCIGPFDLGKIFPFYNPGINTVCQKDLQYRVVVPGRPLLNVC